MRLALGVAVLVLTQQSGCDPSGEKAAPKQDASKPLAAKPPLHRFVLARLPSDSGVAFDTQTGQICRTWDWSPTAPATKDANGLSPQRMIGEFAPTCLSIYEKYPSGSGDAAVPIEDQQPGN